MGEWSRERVRHRWSEASGGARRLSTRSFERLVEATLSDRFLQRVLSPSKLMRFVVRGSTDPVATASKGERLLRAELPLTGVEYLAGYLRGQMALGRYFSEREVHWDRFVERGLITPETARVPKTVRRRIRSAGFEIRENTCPYDVITRCRREDGTWLNEVVFDAICELVASGLVRSVEVFDVEGELVGGEFGLDLGGWYFSISTFSDVSDAGNAAFAFVSEQVRIGRSICVCDVGEMKPHSRSFGAVVTPEHEISRRLSDHLGTRLGALSAP